MCGSVTHPAAIHSKPKLIAVPLGTLSEGNQGVLIAQHAILKITNLLPLECLDRRSPAYAHTIRVDKPGSGTQRAGKHALEPVAFALGAVSNHVAAISAAGMKISRATMTFSPY